MISKPGFCEVKITNDEITLKFLNAENQKSIEVLDDFKILKTK